MANLQTLSGVSQLESTSNSIRSEQDRLSLMDRQLQQMKEGFYSAPTTARRSDDLAAAARGGHSTRTRFRRAKYTDKHPEVQALEEELKSARADAAALRSQPESSRQEALDR